MWTFLTNRSEVNKIILLYVMPDCWQ